MDNDNPICIDPIGPEQTVRIPLDSSGAPTLEVPYAVARCRFRKNGAELSLKLEEMECSVGCMFNLEFLGGPLEGIHKHHTPAQFCHRSSQFLFNDLNELMDLDEVPAGLASYSPTFIEAKWCMQFISVERRLSVLNRVVEDILISHARDAAKNFYQNPDYSIYSKPPTGKHKQLEIRNGFRKAHVDEEIADVILAIWDLSLDTLGSCQKRDSGKAYVAFNVEVDGKFAHSILKSAGIPVELVTKEGSIRASSGKSYQIRTAHIRFDPCSMQEVATAFRECKLSSTRE